MSEQGFYTIRGFSNHIAQAHNRREDKVFLQLKGLAGRGMLESYEGFYGPKGALLFPEDELYRAAVLLAAVNSGIESENMKKLAAHMRDGFNAALDAAKTGASDVWILEIARILEFETDTPGIYVNWIKNGRRLGTDPVDPLSPDTMSLGGNICGVLQIPVSVLIVPLWREMQKAEGQT